MRNIAPFIFLIFSVFTSGCVTDADPEIETSETVEAIVSLSVNDFISPDGTRASTPGNSDEMRILNALVFQFDANTGELLKNSDELLQPEDADGANNFKVGFINDKESIIAIIANIHDVEWIYENYSQRLVKEEFKRYDTFLEVSLPTERVGYLQSTGIHTTGIPMFGVSKKITITNKAFVMVQMERLFARVDVTVDFNAVSAVGNKFNITNLIYRNIPGYCRLKSLAESDDVQGAYPEGIEWKTYEAGGDSRFSLFMPGNLQGKVSGMTSKQYADPAKIPEHALTIDIEIQYEKDGSSKTHKYSVYPGLDEINDFNVKRNRIYDVNIKLTKLPE